MTDTEGHTPGPWEIFTIASELGESYRIFAPPFEDKSEAVDIAHIPKDWDGHANAILIAAAPETAAERDRLKDELTKTNIALNNFDEGTGLIIEERDELKVEVKRLSNRIEAMLDHEAELVKALESVMKFRNGVGEYNFSIVPRDEQENAYFDKWQEIENEILAALSPDSQQDTTIEPETMDMDDVRRDPSHTPEGRISSQLEWTHIADIEHPNEMRIYVANGALKINFMGKKDPASFECFNAPIRVIPHDSQEEEG